MEAKRESNMNSMCSLRINLSEVMVTDYNRMRGLGVGEDPKLGLTYVGITLNLKLRADNQHF